MVPLKVGRKSTSSRRLGWLLNYWEIKGLLREMAAHCQECVRQMSEKQFDILFANSCAFFATSPIARYARIPTVLYLHEPHRRFYEALPELPWLAPSMPERGQRSCYKLRLLTNTVWLHGLRIQAREEVTNAKAFDRILANSLYSRESILRAYGVESRVCYLGVDTEHFRPTGEPVENYLVGLGAINYNKGVDRAIRAVGALSRGVRPKLLWVGNHANPGYVEEVQNQAKALGVEFEVRILVSDNELVALLSRAAAMLYTSRLEPFGLAPLEANACGVPVVAIAEGGVRESIEHGVNGLLVPSDSPREIAAAISAILDDPARASEMRRKARESVMSRWGLEAAVSRLEAALENVAASSRAQPFSGIPAMGEGLAEG
jgi:glycosyltransferase involved in cell wall biosynthesis